jgi:Tfp pilus assembly protein FimT
MQRFVMETVTVAATRGFTLSEMEILVGSAVVLAVLAWTALSSLKHFRARQLPRVVKN